MATRVHLPDDHNHTTECFKRTTVPSVPFQAPDTTGIVDWDTVGYRVVEYVCVAVLGGMAALRIWGASC